MDNIRKRFRLTKNPLLFGFTKNPLPRYKKGAAKGGQLWCWSAPRRDKSGSSKAVVGSAPARPQQAFSASIRSEAPTSQKIRVTAIPRGLFPALHVGEAHVVVPRPLMNPFCEAVPRHEVQMPFWGVVSRKSRAFPLIWGVCSHFLISQFSHKP